MTVKEIVAAYLTTHGHDGLAGDQCGCEISDLMPCGGMGSNCVPGKKIMLEKGCDCDCGMNWPHAWHMVGAEAGHGCWQREMSGQWSGPSAEDVGIY